MYGGCALLPHNLLKKRNENEFTLNFTSFLITIRKHPVLEPIFLVCTVRFLLIKSYLVRTSWGGGVGGVGYSPKFTTGVCRWVPENLDLFQRKNDEFTALFQTNVAKNRYQGTSRVTSLPC